MPYYMKGKKGGSSGLVRKLDGVFSRYIRLRDAMSNGYFRCISCGRILPASDADAGHYFSRRHMATRFDEDNVHSECKACNRFSSDHIIEYGKNLQRLIGEQRFKLLEVKARQTRKWEAFELEAMIKHYKDEVKRLEEEKGIKL